MRPARHAGRGRERTREVAPISCTFSTGRLRSPQVGGRRLRMHVVCTCSGDGVAVP